ncbi:hypothetical protein [Aeromonas veronii]|uniref:hypothetical protein n=1 Tax=Aeromonas veronii TaxID=654 RepID=UPI0024449E04|nr:hypothetical protein [Aeromonas veronii]
MSGNDMVISLLNSYINQNIEPEGLYDIVMVKQRELLKPAASKMADIIKFNQQVAAELNSTAKEEEEKSEIINYSICVVALLIAGIISQLLYVKIKKPMDYLVEQAGFISSGDLTKNINKKNILK